LGPAKSRPGRSGPSWRGVDPGGIEDFPHGGGADLVAHAFYHSALYPFLRRINAYLVRWTRKKYTRLRPLNKALARWRRITRQYPRLFAH
jgi:hypothetical protein